MQRSPSTQTAPRPVKVQHVRLSQVIQGQVVQPRAPVKPRQLPPMQSWVLLQVRPQSPQFCGSVAVVTHVVPQNLRPLLQDPNEEQVPLTQSCVTMQRRPTIPQLLPSVWRLTQRSPVAANPGRHAHMPEIQSWSLRQRVPMAPQLTGSDAVFTHPLGPRVVPAGQVQTPAMHERPLGHWLPQRPQWLVLVPMFTH